MAESEREVAASSSAAFGVDAGVGAGGVVGARPLVEHAVATKRANSTRCALETRMVISSVAARGLLGQANAQRRRSLIEESEVLLSRHSGFLRVATSDSLVATRSALATVSPNVNGAPLKICLLCVGGRGLREATIARTPLPRNGIAIAIVLAEDEAWVRQVAQRILKRAGQHPVGIRGTVDAWHTTGLMIRSGRVPPPD